MKNHVKSNQHVRKRREDISIIRIVKERRPNNLYMLAIAAAAQYLGVSISTLRRWDRMGILIVYRTVGMHRRYRRGQLEGFLMWMKARSAQARNNEHLKKNIAAKGVKGAKSAKGRKIPYNVPKIAREAFTQEMEDKEGALNELRKPTNSNNPIQPRKSDKPLDKPHQHPHPRPHLRYTDYPLIPDLHIEQGGFPTKTC